MAIDDAQLQELRSLRGDPARRSYVAELEENIEDYQDTDKAWYLLFHCFRSNSSDGNPWGITADDLRALQTLFMGGRRMHRADFYIINCIERERVAAIADALSRVAAEWLRSRYDAINKGWFHAGEYHSSDTQFLYCTQWLEHTTRFFEKHRCSTKHILFTSQYE